MVSVEVWLAQETVLHELFNDITVAGSRVDIQLPKPQTYLRCLQGNMVDVEGCTEPHLVVLEQGLATRVCIVWVGEGVFNPGRTIMVLDGAASRDIKFGPFYPESIGRYDSSIIHRFVLERLMGVTTK